MVGFFRMYYEKTVGKQTVLPSFKPQKTPWCGGVKVSLIGQVGPVGRGIPGEPGGVDDEIARKG